MTKVYKPLLDALGLTYPQYLVLLVLWEQDDVMVSQIGERLFLDSGTLTPLLKRLESAGLVHRARDSDDERRVRITLTDASHRLQQQALSVPDCVLSQSQLDLPQVRALTQQLQALRGTLTGSGPNVSPPSARQTPL